MVILNDYDLIREAFVTKGTEFGGRPYDERALSYNNTYPHPPGIIDGDISDEWKKQRNNALNILRNLGWGKSSVETKIQEEAFIMHAKLKEIGGKPYDPAYLIGQSVANIICALLFGKRYNYEDPELKLLLDTLDDLLGGLVGETDAMYIPVLKLTSSYKKAIKKLMTVGQTLQTFYIKMIEEGKKKFASGEEPSDFVTMYLAEMKKEKASRITEDWLQQLISDFFMAGSETTATTLKWCMLYMAMYPEVQAKVQQEMDDLYGHVFHAFSLSDREKLPYTDATITELQRVSAIAALGIQHRTTVKCHIGGYTIPKDAEVCIS